MKEKSKLFEIVGLVNYLFVVFLNAFTDLGHKIIIQNTIFKVYDGQEQIVLTTIVNALILLPFILMFSPSGYLADRYPKNIIMKYSSILAIFITSIITFSYYMGWFYLAFAMTFLLALQSAIYSPAKYGYIKELVGTKFISGANGAVQAVTTLAILGGMIFYTVLFEFSITNDVLTKENILEMIAPLGWLLIIGSLIEFYLASKLPNKMKKATSKKFDFKKYVNFFYLQKNLKTVKRKQEIFDSIISLSLFLSITQVVLAIFGEYAKSNLGITNTIIVQGVMALSGLGVVMGSIISAKFSKYFINIGLVSFGAMGITVILFFLPFSSSTVSLSILFMLFGIFSALIIVPLNAQIQYLAPRVHLGTILAGSNFIQNIFMVSFLLLTTIFAYFGMDGEILMYCMGVVGIYLTIRVFKHYFIMTFWTIVEMILSTRHKYNYVGLENIPKTEGVLLLGNHVSWIDWILLQFPLDRKINYMMEKDIYYWKYFNYFAKKGEAIPVSKKGAKDALKEAGKRLQNKKIVGIFPEGGITDNGETQKFFRGYEMIPKDYEGNIVPFYIDGVFGSIFSRYKPKSKKSIFSRREITVYFGKPVDKNIKAQELQEIVTNLKIINT